MGGNVNQVPSGFTEKQWKKLDPLIQKACEQNANLKLGIANALARGLSISEINDHYRNDAVVMGLAVEKNDDGSVKVPAESTAAMLDNKDNRAIITEQWQAYFKERYTNNREEARHDMVRLLSHNEVKQLQNSFTDLWLATDDTDPAKRNASMRLKMKYVNEHPEKLELMDQRAQQFIDTYKDKLDDPDLIGMYKLAFAPETTKAGMKSNTQNITIKKLTMDDLKALAQFKALNELPMNPDEIGMACEELAIQAIEDRHLNSGIAEYNDCQMQIEQIINENRQNPEIQKLSAEYRSKKAELQQQLKTEKDTTKRAELKKQLRELKEQFNKDCDAHLPQDVQKKVRKLAEKADKAFKKANDKENEFFEKNIEKLVEVAALSQVTIEQQRHKYETTPAPEYNDLPAEVQVLVTTNPTMFCEEITDPNDTREPTFTDKSTGKKYIFKGEKYKEQMLAYSRAGKTAGKEQTNQEGDDYYCDLQESDQAYWGLKFGGLGDDKNTKRNVIKKAMEAAGITTEADHTTQQRIAHILKSAGIGALSGAGAVFVGDFLNTLRNIPGTEKIFELASLTKMIPFKKIDEIRIKEHLSGDDASWNYNAHLSGDDATWNYNEHRTGDDATWNYNEHRIGDDAAWTGSGDWSFDDVVTSHHSVVDYEDGILTGHREWDEDIPVHGEGTITISGNNGHWETDINVSGNNGHWETDINVSGNNGHWETDINASGNDGHWETDVNASGKDGHWEYDYEYSEDRKITGEVENPDAERELYEQKGTKKRGFKFEFSSPAVYGYAAAGGAISGAIKGALEANKIRDKGLRRNAEGMRVVSQKEIRKKPVDQPQPTKEAVEPPLVPFDAKMDFKDESTPEKNEVTVEEFTVNVDVRKPEKRGDRIYYQGWNTLQAAYGFEEDPKDRSVGIRFRNWFREKFIDDGRTVWPTDSKQDFEKTISYEDRVTHKKYELKFDTEVFAKAIDFREPKKEKKGKAPTLGNTKPRSETTTTHTPANPAWRGSISVTIGKKTYTASATGKTQAEAKANLRAALRNKYPQDKYPLLTDSQITSAIAKAELKKQGQ